MKTWHVDERHDQNAIADRKRWRAVVDVASLLFLGRLVRSMSGFGKRGFVRITVLGIQGQFLLPHWSFVFSVERPGFYASIQKPYIM